MEVLLGAAQTARQTTFPNVEEATALRVRAELGIEAGTQMPNDLRASMPFALAYRFGGRDNGVEDISDVAVDIYSATYAEGRDLAEEIRQVVLATPCVVVLLGGRRVVLDSAETLTAPIEVDFSMDDVRKWTATYRIVARR